MLIHIPFLSKYLISFHGWHAHVSWCLTLWNFNKFQSTKEIKEQEIIRFAWRLGLWWILVDFAVYRTWILVMSRSLRDRYTPEKSIQGCRPSICQGKHMHMRGAVALSVAWQLWRTMQDEVRRQPRSSWWAALMHKQVWTLFTHRWELSVFLLWHIISAYWIPTTVYAHTHKYIHGLSDAFTGQHLSLCMQYII